MKVGITFNLKEPSHFARGRRKAPKPSAGLPEDAFEEFDTSETIEALASALRSGGHEVVLLGWGIDVVRKVRREKVDFVFNIAEGIKGRCRESLMPAIFELLEIPYSGSDPLTLALTLDKAQAKIIVSHAGVQTPEFKVINHGFEISDLPPFPLFVKPLHEGSSKGIRESSKVETQSALRQQVSWLWQQYGKIPLLVERYIAGREFTVGLLGNHKPYLLGIMEIRFRQKTANDFIYSLEVKRDWEAKCEYIAPARISRALQAGIEEAALLAYKSLACRDVARIDFRVDFEDRIYFLEANPLPGLSPVSGDLVILARHMGWSYEKLVLTILKHSQERQHVL